MNIPNILTACRIFAIPLFVVVVLSNFEGKEITAFCIFILAVITDTLDGIWARRKNQITIFGEFLDPIADKLLVSSAFICLVEMGEAPAWMVVIIIGRELAVTGFRAIASSQGTNIPASKLGKNKMISEATTISLLLLGERYLGRFYILAKIGLWIVLFTALLSALEYCVKFGRQVLSKRS